MASEPQVPPQPEPEPRGLAVGGLVLALLVASALSAVILAIAGRPTAVDDAVHSFTRDWADALPRVVDVAEFIGAATGPLLSTIYGIAIAVGLFLTSRRAAAVFLAVSCLVGVLAVEAMKLVVGRERPPGAEQFVDDLEKSFPSGHSAAGIYLYLTLGLILVRLAAAGWPSWLRGFGIALILFGPMVGLSRVVLGVHWATDVLAGWAYGSAAALLSALICWSALNALWRAGRRTSSPDSGGPER